MNRSLIALTVLMFVLLGLAEPVSGHHRFFGVLDLKKPIVFEGTVTKVQWTNPHVAFWVDVKDASGKTINWRFEGGNVAALMMRGWKNGDLKTGDKITITGYRAKDGSFVAGAGAVMLADGRMLDAASDGVPPMVSARDR